jgi:hypothetical protein
MRRLLIVAAVVAGFLAPAALVEAAPYRAIQFPAHHTVKSGEWLWSIARQFLNRVDDEYDQPGEPSKQAIDNEVAQIRKLNRDELAGQHGQVYPGQRLLLANSVWDVPDGTPGWGAGFSWCTNGTPPVHSRAPFDDMSLSVQPRHPPLTSGTREKVMLAVTNHSDRTRRFNVQLERAVMVDRDGRGVVGVIHSDAIGVAIWKMDPHSRSYLPVQMRVKTCGDVPELDRPVSPGHYRLYGVFRWDTKHRGHTWASAANDVRVVD